MTDMVSAQRRSEIMRRIRSTDTTPEITVRRVLHGMGYRFRLHVGTLPGRPDIVLPKYKTAILVHGCFWHRHRGCGYAKLPASNRAFWHKKLPGNVERDSKKEKLLLERGWRVLTIWECATRRGQADVNRLAVRIVSWIRSARRRGEIPQRRGA